MSATGSTESDEEYTQAARDAGRSVYGLLREALVTGVAVVVPLFVTGYVLVWAVGLVSGWLDPLVGALKDYGVAPGTSEVIIKLVTVASLVTLVFVVGFVAHFRYGRRAIEYLDLAVTSLPGVGTVYESFRKMGDVMIESDAKNFREVKLVEFPDDGIYTLGFLTARTPEEIQSAAAVDGTDAGDEMITLFLPLAPNPVMGGFLVHVPEARVRDVDMTVEEGVRTVVTSGVATRTPGEGRRELSEDELRELTVKREGTGRIDPNDGPPERTDGRGGRRP